MNRWKYLQWTRSIQKQATFLQFFVYRTWKIVSSWLFCVNAHVSEVSDLKVTYKHKPKLNAPVCHPGSCLYICITCIFIHQNSMPFLLIYYQLKLFLASYNVILINEKQFLKRSELLIFVCIQVIIIVVVTLCNIIVGYQHFGSICSLQLIC